MTAALGIAATIIAITAGSYFAIRHPGAVLFAFLLVAALSAIILGGMVA